MDGHTVVRIEVLLVPGPELKGTSGIMGIMLCIV